MAYAPSCGVQCLKNKTDEFSSLSLFLFSALSILAFRGSIHNGRQGVVEDGRSKELRGHMLATQKSKSGEAINAQSSP